MENDELKTKRSNPLLEKSYAFALSIIKLARKLQLSEKEFILSKQVLRSGTAVGALSEEAQQAESKADFIYKLAIANKEANESNYWLRLIKDSKLDHEETDRLISESEELKRLLISIIKTSKSK